ncbi:hypothetical protein [Pseudolysinimonas sp.]|uniref:PepSY domain-containing protein n=1 Tax=Pseudolysinimonas sp. TaxID=2680009 RepID=UPI00286A8054|nr:hypothetical protein [Pseudolysinimonas sp.]
MRNATKIAIAAGSVVISAALLGAALAPADDGDDAWESEAPITGNALATASDVALAHTGGGTVTDTEVGDEESYYEVEVTLADGTEVDVQLDEKFVVVGDESDDTP